MDRIYRINRREEPKEEWLTFRFFLRFFLLIL